MAALDKLAGPDDRPGTVALATITASTFGNVATKAGMAPSSSCESGRVCAGPSSVLPVECPRPGKCFAVASAPPRARPWANAPA